MLPSIFGESLFDDWMDFPFRGFSNDVDHKLYGKNAARVMKTDLKEVDGNYELDIDMPGYKKEDLSVELKDGYITVAGNSKKENDEKDEKGRYVRRERYTGVCKRSFYVGENLEMEDIKAGFQDGVLHLTFPKEKEPAPEVEENRFIQIQ